MTPHRFGILVLCLAFCATLTPAQFPPCPTDDGFDTGCCNVPQPQLPNFPPTNIGGLWGCIHNCALEAQFNVQVAVSAPQFIACDLAVVNLTMGGSTATSPNFAGALLAKYDRTWIEFLTNGGTRQVWRFLVNGDVNFNPSIALSAPCPQPPCSANNTPVHLTGHIDYARNCTTPGTVAGGWSVALNVNHVSGCINHAPASARPMVGPPAHENRTYCLVAPGNFIFGPSSVPSGPLRGDSVRSSSLNLTAFPAYQCFSEAHVVNGGSVADIGTFCLNCSPALPISPAIWHHQSIQGGVGCGPLTVVFPFHTVPIPPVFPTGMISMEIGTYVGINPDAFPTGRSISLNYGVMQYFDNCLPNDFPYFVYTGVGSQGGSPAILFGSPIVAGATVNSFLDMQSMELPNAVGSFGPGLGALFLPRKVWSLNTM
ncbi:MAG: hypothetical protein KDB53_16815 [Planctomycetes bacterium]|nr:hypothetical protein [Planctomycetota bacterium]